jgi:hypothetical protein
MWKLLHELIFYVKSKEKNLDIVKVNHEFAQSDDG